MMSVPTRIVGTLIWATVAKIIILAHDINCSKFMISYWDEQYVRDIFKEYNIAELVVYYVSTSQHRKELLIMNFDSNINQSSEET